MGWERCSHCNARLHGDPGVYSPDGPLCSECGDEWPLLGFLDVEELEDEEAE